MHLEDWDEKEDGRGLLMQLAGIIAIFIVMFAVAYAIVLLAS